MAQPLIASGVVFAVTKGFGIINKLDDIELSTYLTFAGMMGASKIVADLSVPDPIQRAVGSGLLFAGACYLVFKNENWALNGALGVGASYLADIVVPAPPPPKEEDTEDEYSKL